MAAASTAWIPNQDLVVQANPDASVLSADPPNLLLHPRRESFPFSNDVWAWHLMRLVSIALGALTVWTTYHVARAGLPAEPDIAWAAAGFVAFLPGFLLISSAVTNDGLIVAIATLTVWQWLRLLKRPPRVRDSVLLGVLLGLALLAKTTGLALWAISGIVLLWLAWRDRRWIGHAALVLALAVAIGSPWLLYNLSVGGDILAWSRVFQTHARPTLMAAHEWPRYAAGMYASFWGRAGGAAHIWLPAAVYVLLGSVWLLAALGLWRRFSDARQSAPLERQMMALFGLFAAVLLAAHLRFSLTIGGADQARQVFPILPPAAIVLALGLGRATRPWRAGLALFTAGMAVFSLLFIAYTGSTFAARPLSPAAVPSLGNQTADFGGQMRVASYAIEQQAESPTTEVTVTLYCQALSNPIEVYWLLLRLVGPQGPVATADGVPAEGRATTDRWLEGQVFASRHILPVPAAVPAGTYRLELGFHPQGRWQWLPASGQDTFLLGEVQVRR